MSDAIIGGIDTDMTDQPAGELGEIITSDGMKYFWNGSKWVSLGPVNEANYGQTFSGGGGGGGEGATYSFTAPLNESNGTVTVNLGAGSNQVARGDHTHTNPVSSERSTTYLRGDGSWVVPPSGGGGGGGATALDGLSDVNISSVTNGQVLKYSSSTSEWINSDDNTGSGSGGSGTVTSVSVATANGFAGSVVNSTTTPAITISTGVSGLLKGNGVAVSAAVEATDYQSPKATISTINTNPAATTSGTVLFITGSVTLPSAATSGWNILVISNGTALTVTLPSGATVHTAIGGGNTVSIAANKYASFLYLGSSKWFVVGDYT